jgi:succinate dehydrogenase / fumarate reductase iron-sulfur subunit
MDVKVKILRYNPEVTPDAEWKTYSVTLQPGDRVLDALHKIKWEQDGTLTFRRSCAHGVCGSDAMRINGRNRLACKTLIKDLNPDKEITVEPIKGLAVLKDLVVDMEPFFDAYRSIMPFLVTSGHEPTRERIQSQADRERFDDTTKCILCAACTTSCPVFWSDGQYFGPQVGRCCSCHLGTAAQVAERFLPAGSGDARPPERQVVGQTRGWSASRLS